MPYKAITSEKKIIYSFDYNKFQLIDWHRSKGGLFCPHCATEMFPRSGDNRKLHFAHKSRTALCGSTMKHHPESKEHDYLKYVLFDITRKHIASSPAKDDLYVELEVALRRCGKNGRIADIGLFYKNEIFGVIEIQLAAISQESLTERIEDYNEQRIESYWFFGKSADKPENYQCALKYTGFYGQLEIDSFVSSNTSVGVNQLEGSRTGANIGAGCAQKLKDWLSTII